MKRLLRSGTWLCAALFFAILAGPALAAQGQAGKPAAAPAAPAATAAKMQKAAPAKPATAPAMHERVHHRMSLAMRKQIQTALNAHGASLKVDGMLGKRSREAIARFQHDNGLKATGWADKATLDKLGVK